MDYKLPFKEYNRALRKSRLLGLRCNSCGAITCPPKMSCQECTGLDLSLIHICFQGANNC